LLAPLTPSSLLHCGTRYGRYTLPTFVVDRYCRRDPIYPTDNIMNIILFAETVVVLFGPSVLK